MIRFNANLFRIAFTCTSDEETRYYLKGVFVEPHAQGGVTLTATDGHRLIVIRDADGFANETAIVALGDGLKQCKPKRGERRDVVIHTGESNAHIMLTTLDDKGDLTDTPIATAYSVKVGGTYPDYRRIVPQQFAAEGAPGFNGRYISDFGDVACELSAIKNGKPTKHSTNPIRILPSEGNGPALILFPASDFAFGVLMPVRTADTSSDVLAWFRYPAPTAQAAE